jgi:hypothetical protein
MRLQQRRRRPDVPKADPAVTPNDEREGAPPEGRVHVLEEET